MLYSNYLLAIVLGAAISIYMPMISQSSRILGSPIMGNVPFFFVALVTSVVISLFAGQRVADYARIVDVPWWMLLAGMVSALMIIGSSFLIPRIGTGAFFVMIVTGQILIGFVINQFGLLGVPAEPLNLVKALGGVLVIAGAALVTFSGP